MTVRLVEDHLQCAFVTAGRLLDQFAELGIVREMTGSKRNRRYEHSPYMALFEPAGITRYARKAVAEGSRADAENAKGEEPSGHKL